MLDWSNKIAAADSRMPREEFEKQAEYQGSAKAYGLAGYGNESRIANEIPAFFNSLEKEIQSLEETMQGFIHVVKPILDMTLADKPCDIGKMPGAVSEVGKRLSICIGRVISLNLNLKSVTGMVQL